MTDAYKQAYNRERLARLEAENLLEEKSRSLYKLNQELEKKNAFLEQQQVALLRQDKLATIGMLSAGIAHEVNNPLSFICSNLDILKNYWRSESQFVDEIKSLLLTKHVSSDCKSTITDLIKKYDIDYIHDDTTELLSDTDEGLQRVKAIVQNLRSFSRSKSDDSAPSDLNEAINSTLKLINSQITQNRVSVVTDLKPLRLVMCNMSEIKQVLLNLMVNAIHAMETSSTKQLIINSKETDSNQVLVEITDTGSGIKKEDLPNIFTPFYTTKTIGNGTGMGLSITEEIIKDHKASISVQSELGKGSTFSLLFNL